MGKAWRGLSRWMCGAWRGSSLVMLSRRVTTRIILTCSVIVFLLPLSLIIFSVELDHLESDEVISLPKGLELNPVVNTPLCPKTGEDAILPQTKGYTMDEVYRLLMARKQYELRVEKSTREIWWYTHKRLEGLPQHNILSYLNATLVSVKNQILSLQSRQKELNQHANSGFFSFNWALWQKNLSVQLTDVMKKRLDYLQNPFDCDSARKLVCHVAKSCGFGCQIHHVSYCFIMAYATKRTLILDSANWRYSPNGWNAVFQPISSVCIDLPSGILANFYAIHSHSNISDTQPFSIDSKAQSVYLPPIDSLSPRPKQLPMAIPNDLTNRYVYRKVLPI